MGDMNRENGKMKVYVVSTDYGSEGYSEPLDVFVSLERLIEAWPKAVPADQPPSTFFSRTVYSIVEVNA